MKVELIGHDEKYALEQSLLTLFPGEKPVYGTVDEKADAHWARVTLSEENDRVQVTTELGIDGRSAAHSYDYPLSGTDYEKEGQRRHAVGISFFGAAKDLLGISPAWGSLTGVRPAKVALSLIREGGKAKAERELQELYCVQPARARLAIEAADAGIRAAAELEPNDISLYVGIPFCPTRCAYCSFVAQSVEKSFSIAIPIVFVAAIATLISVYTQFNKKGLIAFGTLVLLVVLGMILPNKEDIYANVEGMFMSNLKSIVFLAFVLVYIFAFAIIRKPIVFKVTEVLVLITGFMLIPPGLTTS